VDRREWSTGHAARNASLYRLSYRDSYVKEDFKEMEWQDVEKVHLAEDRIQSMILMDTETNNRVPLKLEKVLSS
jgi:hypothetical protein